MTLNRVMAVISRKEVVFGASYVKSIEARVTEFAFSRKILVLGIIWFITADSRFSRNFFRMVTHSIFSLFELCNVVRPSE